MKDVRISWLIQLLIQDPLPGSLLAVRLDADIQSLFPLVLAHQSLMLESNMREYHIHRPEYHLVIPS